jgi:hypothetical protein
MVKTIGVIGVGSLGSFVAHHLSNIDGIEKLIIIDPDIVEENNLRNSIYRKNDVGKSKVESLTKYLGCDSITIPSSYDELKTEIPKTDLLIDCRDVGCSRYGKIDVRLFISERTLVIDCERYVKYDKPVLGKYILELSRNTIDDAAYYIKKIFVSRHIFDLIKQQSSSMFRLDKITQDFCQPISDTLEMTDNIDDMIYEAPKGYERLRRVDINTKPIMVANQKSDLPVFIGEENDWKTFSGLHGSPSKFYDIIQRGSITGEYDVMQKLSNIVSRMSGDCIFFVQLIREGKETKIVLIKETNSA